MNYSKTVSAAYREKVHIKSAPASQAAEQWAGSVAVDSITTRKGLFFLHSAFQKKVVDFIPGHVVLRKYHTVMELEMKSTYGPELDLGIGNKELV